MKSNKLSELLQNSIDNISTIIDSSKIIGKPIMINEQKILIPIAKVSFGIGAGGSEFNASNITEKKKKTRNDLLFEFSDENYPYGGASITGVSIRPEAFLIIDQNKINIVYMDKNPSLFEKCFEIFTDIVKKK